MAEPVSLTLHQLGPQDLSLMRGMLTLFGQAFDDMEPYTGALPDDAYLADVLASETFIAIAALDGERLIGALAGYELKTFEQQRSELYIYDLAVDDAFRRRGIATALIRQMQAIAVERGAHVVFVQADYGDDPAIALYTKLGEREDVLHFDLPPRPNKTL